MTPQAQNIKLRRQLRQERETYRALLDAKVDAESYQLWKQKTDAAIDRMNAATRAGYGWDYPGARQGMPRDVAEAIKAHKRQAA